MPSKKPKVGDLVMLDDLAQAERGYHGLETGRAGVVIRCEGTRCIVRWHGDTTTRPERGVLEVLSRAAG